MQQVLDAKIASVPSLSLSGAFPLHISKGLGPVINSVAKDRPKPDADYAMKLLAKVLYSSFDHVKNYDPTKRHYTVLFIGETGTGKSLFNTFINFLADPSDPPKKIQNTNHQPPTTQVPCLR